MFFHTTEQLGPVQSTTREGFLVCEGVPIARTGILFYAPGELPVPPGPDGLIRVHRAEDAVFSDAAMASFEGKPVTNGHPSEDVTPENWRQLAVGHVQHVRRGQGAQADLLLADLVVKDAASIYAIRNGLRHVSAGYDARYRVFAPGNAQQTNISGNHVALVPEGRCGSTCSIGDQSMPHWMDRIRTAFATRDDAAFASALAEAGHGAGNGAATIINLGSGTMRARDEEAEPEKKGMTVAELAEKHDALAEKHEALSGAHAELAEKHGELHGKHEALRAEHDELKAAVEAGEKQDGDKDKKTGDGESAKAGDSGGLVAEWQDTVSRAEILAPGMAVPTFDAAADTAAGTDAICAFRRAAMQAALVNPGTRAHVEAMLAPGQSVTSLTCDAAAAAFRGASELARHANNTGTTGRTVAADTTRRGPPTPAEINARNAKFYAARK